MDQSAVAVEPCFLFDQGAHFGFAVAYRLRKRAMSESLGMLEPGHGDDDDRRRPLHARMRILCGDDGETVCTRRRRAAARSRRCATDEIETCRYHGGSARRS